MHYRSSTPQGAQDAADPLDKFCREMGIEIMNTQSKFVVTRTNLPTEMQVVVLAARGQASV
jgi:hypothetical protein